MTEDRWYRRTLRWAQTNLVEIDPLRYDGDFWRAHWERTRVEGAIINAGGIVAYYPSEIPLHRRAPTLGARDLYGEIVASAREAGLSVVARMDSNRVAEEFYRAHADWICLDAEGRPYMQADKYITCINSPYYSEYLPQILTEIIERSQPDGFSDNSWAGIDRGRICHCRHCKAAFGERTGLDLPRYHDVKSETYREWLRWNYRRRTEVWELNNEITSRAGGEDCVWAGMLSGDVLNNCRRFIDLPEILSRSKIIMLDHQRRSREDGFAQNAEAGKRLHGLIGWDALIPESMPQYQNAVPFFRHAAMPETEVRLWSGAGFAGGIQPWWHHIGANHDDRRQYLTAEPIFRWHQANEDILVDREPVADVGILWSQANHDYFGADDAVQRTLNPYRGVVRALDAAGITYLPLHPSRIAGADVGVLILPNLAAMSDAEIAAVEAFAAAGGSVLATSETSAYDVTGDARAALGLGALFGLKATGDHLGATGTPDPNHEISPRHSYLRLLPEHRAGAYGPRDETAPAVEGERHPILAGLEGADMIPFGGYLPVMRAEEGTEVLATYVPDFPIYPPETSWMRTPRTQIAAITLRRGPAGGTLVWLVADLDRCFAREEHPEHGTIIANAVRFMLGEKQKVAIEGGSGFVMVNAYAQGERCIVHLNNILVTAATPGRQHELIGLGPVRVRLAVPGSGDVAATARVAGNALEVTREDGFATFEVAEVRDQEVVVLDPR